MTSNTRWTRLLAVCARASFVLRHRKRHSEKRAKGPTPRMGERGRQSGASSRSIHHRPDRGFTLTVFAARTSATGATVASLQTAAQRDPPAPAESCL